MKECSGIRCPFCRIGKPSECNLIDDCEYFTQKIDGAEVMDNLLDMIAERVTEKIKKMQEDE